VTTFGLELENAIQEGTEKIKDQKAAASRAVQIMQRWTGQKVKYREPPAVRH
jgi:hypothetical protein